MRTTALAILTVCAFALAACDSGAPDADALVGTWITEYEVERVLAASDRAQTIVDRNRPAEGALTFTGAVSGSVSYVHVVDGGGGAFAVSAFSADPQSAPLPASFARLDLTPTHTQLIVRLNGTYAGYDLLHLDGPAPYTFTDGRLTLTPTTLPPADGSPGPSVTVSGALTPPTIALAAGREQEVERRTDTRPGEHARIRTFSPDGTYRAWQPGLPEYPAEVGTWEAPGDGQVRIVVTSYSPPQTTDATYRVEDGRLLLTTSQDVCAPAAPLCLSSYAGAYAMEPQSLTRLRNERTARLAPVTP